MSGYKTVFLQNITMPMVEGNANSLYNNAIRPEGGRKLDGNRTVPDYFYAVKRFEINEKGLSHNHFNISFFGYLI